MSQESIIDKIKNIQVKYKMEEQNFEEKINNMLPNMNTQEKINKMLE